MLTVDHMILAIFIATCCNYTLSACEHSSSSSIPYIANRLRWKSFMDGEASSNSPENFRGLPTPFIFKTKMCSRALTTLYNTRKMPSFTTRELLILQWWMSLE